MQRSAEALGIPLEPRDLPDDAAVRRLHAATGGAGSEDIRLRIPLTGGSPSTVDGRPRATLWMAAGPLPPPPTGAGARIIHSILVDPGDPLIRHKTLNYWRRRLELERAGEQGSDEVLCLTPLEGIVEGARSNLFLVEDGALITPGVEEPLLDGVMRRVVIDRARDCGIPVEEVPVGYDTITLAHEAFLTNSVRGMLPVARLLHATFPSPGPVTRLLWSKVLAWLESGGTTP
jgi:branched-subunit amino acid aminotransferase/4-amino-4-deoxychorismate lyase